MAIFDKGKITDIGRQLLAQAQTLGQPINITYCKTSSHNYYDNVLEQLTDLEDIEQSFLILEKSIINDTTVKITANFDNNTLAEGYDLYTFGVYANLNGGDDVLFLVGATNNPDSVPPVSSSRWQTLINPNIEISNTDDITITINYAANATQQYVQDYVKSKLESETIVTIPADDPTDSPYTEETDSDSNTYYTIEINVTGMISSYKGVRDAKPVYPRPYNVDGKVAIDELFALIQDGDSLDGKIKLYFNEKPDTQFQIYLYGV